MELRTIYLGDVRPDPNNPREDFGDIHALADSFALNPVNPGEPFTPIIVVKDGDVYRIVDGERRYRAMVDYFSDPKRPCNTGINADPDHWKMWGINAVVCDDLDDADSAVAMLITDDKQQLSDLEKSRGYQTMLLLGVPEVKVDSIGRFETGTATRMKRGAELAGEKARQFTLDHLLALERYSDDEEDVDRILKASNDKLYTVVSDIEKKRENARTVELLVEECARRGIEAIDTTVKTRVEINELFEGYRFKGTIYSTPTSDGRSFTFPDHDGLPAKVSYNVYHWGGVGMSLYVQDDGADEVQEDPEVAAAREEALSIYTDLEKLESDLLAWFVDHQAKGKPAPWTVMPRIMAWITAKADAYLMGIYTWERIKRTLEEAGAEADLQPSLISGAIALEKYLDLVEQPYLTTDTLTTILTSGDVSRFFPFEPWREYLDFVDIAREDGFTLGSNVASRMQEVLDMAEGISPYNEDEDIYEVD